MDTQVDDVIDNNLDVIRKFFIGISSCNYLDGRCYRLYLDLDDETVFEDFQTSSQSWIQRNDNTLVEIYRVESYADTPEEGEEWYTDGCDLNDYGFEEFVDKLRNRINDAIAEYTNRRG